MVNFKGTKLYSKLLFLFSNDKDSSQSGMVRAIIGSPTEEDTISLSTVSKRHEMPIMGYVAESGELSDKVCALSYKHINS